MFDANAAHIPTGELFFAEVYGTNANLKEKGINKGDVILCQHITKSGKRNRTIDSTKLWVDKDKAPILYHDSKQSMSDGLVWLVYSGRTDGKGFLDSCEGRVCKGKALNLLGGEWTERNIISSLK